MIDPDLLSGETPLREIRPDPATYWRDHAAMAAAAAVAGLVILLLVRPEHWWVGPVAAVLAIALRGTYLASDTLRQVWILTPTRLIGPGARVVSLASLTTVRRLLGDVQVITASGDKHLMKHVADAPAVVAAILDARDSRRRGGRRR